MPASTSSATSRWPRHREQGRQIADTAARSRARLFLTHNYSALPMVREARAIVADGGIGDLRLVQVEYLQGWLADEVHSKQADWRADPDAGGRGARSATSAPMPGSWRHS